MGTRRRLAWGRQSLASGQFRSEMRGRLSALAGLAAITAVLLLGLHLLAHSRAATPVLGLEPESGSLSGAASIIGDSTASGGKAVQFGLNSTSTNSYVSRQGTQLYVNGQPYHFTGVNMYTANLRNNCVSGYSGGYNDSVLDNDLTEFDSGTGGKARVIRAWFFQHQATTNNMRDWSAFDHTISVARAHGFRIVATLANEWGTCENPSATDSNGLGYRDISWYQGRYKISPDEGGTVSYQQWVSEIASRYKNESAILAWQLMNEGNAANADKSCPSETNANAAILSWGTDILSRLKAADSNHLTSAGMLVDRCGTSGITSDTKISNLAGNDFCEYHDYSSASTSMYSALSYMISQCNGINRPLLVGETGVNLTTISNNLQTRANTFQARFSAQFGAGVAGELPWVWNGSSSSLDYKFEIKPGDPALPIIGSYGMAAPLQ